MPVAERMIKVPAFELPNGISFRGGFVSENLEYLGTNKPAYELAVDFLTHADQSALYLLGLFTKMDVNTGAPEEAKRAALRHYETVHNHRGQGNWNFDAVDYGMETPDKKGGLFLPKGSETVGWIIRPVFEERDGIYLPVAGEGSELLFAEMPPDGYGPRPTVAGLRHPKTGWALSTSPDRALVIGELAQYFSKFVDEKTARKLAEKEVSYSFRRSRGSEKSAVSRYFHLYGDGPFGEFADWDAGRRGSVLGAFPSRSSEEKK